MTSSPDSLRPRIRLALGLVLAAALALRLLYLAHATSQPGFFWDDPDSYRRHAERLASGPDGWRFDFEAVSHGVEGRYYALPPLYPVFLSLFALFPGFPFNAQVAQAVLAVLVSAGLFFLGKEVHSERAGLIAASIYALWLPNVIAVWSTMQEALFVPLLVLAFVLLLRARSFGGFALAGALFGLAALTRSMPLYYLPAAGVLLLAGRGPRKGAASLAGLVLGFALLTVPYSVALSRHLGEPTFIENHGGLRLAARYGLGGERPPGLLETATAIVRETALHPARELRAWGMKANSVLYLNGGRLLQIYLGADTRFGSLLWKAAVHVFADFALVAVLVLAPFGFALGRRPDRAAFLAVWAVLAFGLTVLSGFGGPRSRSSFEPHLMVLAAVVLARDHRPASRAALAGAGVAAAMLGAVLLPQLGRSFAARGSYGVEWPRESFPKRSPIEGAAGFNVLSANKEVEIVLRPRNAGRPTRVSIALEGIPVEEVEIATAEHRVRHPWPVVQMVHVELEARDAETGAPARVYVVVPRPIPTDEES